MQIINNVHSAEKPEELKLDAYHVYVRSNIREETLTSHMSDSEETHTGYVYDETVYEKDEYIKYKLTSLESQVSFLAEKQGYNLVQTSPNVYQFVKSDTPLPSGDYLNPIPYTVGMAIEKDKWYKGEDENIWLALKSGTPTSFEDKEYFDIIEV